MIKTENLGVVKPFGLFYLDRNDIERKEYQFYYFSDKNVNLQSNRSASTDNNFSEENELFWNKSTMIWSSSLGIKKKYTLSNLLSHTPQIKVVSWCHFPFMKRDKLDLKGGVDGTTGWTDTEIVNDNNGHYRFLCMLHSNGLNIYNSSSSGRIYNVVLPCKIQRLWPSKFGLLLERDSSDQLQSRLPQSDIPYIFSILHPLEELKPVLVTLENDMNDQEFFFDINQTIVYSSKDYPIIITYHKVDKVHVIYKLSYKQPTSVKSFGNLHNPKDHQTHTDDQEDDEEYFNKSYHKLNSSTSFSHNTTINGTNGNPVSTTSTSDSQYRFLSHFSEPEKSFIYDENNENIIESELVMTVLLRDQTLKSLNPAKNVFVTLDHQRQPLLVLHIDNHVITYRIQTTITNDLSLEPAFRIDNIQSVSPIFIDSFYYNNIVNSGDHCKSTLEFSHILTLNCDQSLSVYWGRYKISDLQLDTTKESQFVTNSKAIELKQSVFNRVTVRFDNQHEIRTRIKLNQCHLTSTCLYSLSSFIPLDLVSSIYQDFYQYMQLENNSESDSKEDSKEWLSLQIILVSLVQLCSGNKRKEITNQNSSYTSPNDDWNFLLNSNYHKNYDKLVQSHLKLLPNTITTSTPTSDNNGLLIKATKHSIPWKSNFDQFKQNINNILIALHYQYEEFKVLSVNIIHLKSLATFLLQLDYYIRDFGDLITIYNNYKEKDISDKTTKESTESTKSVDVDMDEMVQPFSIYRLVLDSLKLGQSTSEYLEIFNKNKTLDKLHFKWLDRVVSLYSLLNGSGVKDFKEISEKLILKMSELGMNLEDLNSMSYGLVLPLREAIRCSKSSPKLTWSDEIFKLLEREDLLYQFNINDIDSINNNKKVNQLLISKYTSTLVNGNNGNGSKQSILKVTEDGNSDKEPVSDEFYRKIVALRFDRDQRVQEVSRLLSPSIKIQIKHDQETGVSDHDYLGELQNRLLLAANRTISLPIGYGMFNLASTKPLPTETIYIPPIVLNGSVIGQKSTNISLDSTVFPASNLSWPEFHNGVASGIRVSSDQAEITNTWIIYNRPSEFNPSYSGLLLSLGLQKKLSSLAFTKLFEYLAFGHQLTSVGLLLGISCTKMGSMEMSIAKVLSVHIPSLHPPMSIDLDVPSMVQTASVMGIGLLYQGTSNRRMTEVLLMEIGRKPTNDKPFERDSYSLSAGLALGLVNLAKGNSEGSLSDLNLEERLGSYIGIGSEDTFDHISHSNSIYKKSSSIQSQSKTNTKGNGSQIKSNLILEGPKPNIDITSPGAILALALIYLKTSNDKIANYLTIPETSYGLDFVRPDLILLRVFGKSLIMWNQIEPTLEWIHSQVPNIIRTNVQLKPETEQVIHVNSENSDKVDLDLLVLVYCNIIAGLSMAIGMRFAGSQNTHAYRLLMDLLKVFRKRQIYMNKCVKKKIQNESSNRVLRVTTETLINVIALSLSLVMAGSGDLEALQILRSLRSRLSSEITYGNHMAISMSLGFLFLGSGQYTLSTSNLAIACLVCSLFPRFPMSPNDNQYHLQALRHLYYLAIEPRCLVTRDVDTLQPCHVPFDIEYIESHTGKEITQTLITPCLIPEMDKIMSIRIRSPRYWNISITSHQPHGHASSDSTQLKKHPILFVKRKIGYLDYREDPEGFNNLQKSFPRQIVYDHSVSKLSTLQMSREQFLKSFSSDPTLLLFARHFCSDTLSVDTDNFNTSVLYECLTKDKPEILQTLQLMNDISRDIQHYSTQSGSSQLLQNLLVILQFYKKFNHYQLNGNGNENNSTTNTFKKVDEYLVEPSFINLIESRVDGYFQLLLNYNNNSMSKMLCEYFKTLCYPSCSSGNSILSSNSELNNFSSWLVFYDIPSMDSLRSLKNVPSEINISKFQLFGLSSYVNYKSIANVHKVLLTELNLLPK
ncbi:anaphase promoting complex subunit 1 [Tieghemostelium lacteum]|uniref:Anaphase-promoting complex subunit 1 n=1 Tax=Tieghemostelium lacteum TaxID=361077 RepID=A0A151ZSH4_TIELA|nr:anaphase promoting complex subunit 1 [Tieghemostelium lacteum]|eukprot:KYQ96888.1 anaphase promoting complex subunit 1 [Tieghemostelium lacteum]